MALEELKNLLFYLLKEDKEFKQELYDFLKYDEDFTYVVGEAYENYESTCSRVEAEAWV